MGSYNYLIPSSMTKKEIHNCVVPIDVIGDIEWFGFFFDIACLYLLDARQPEVKEQIEKHWAHYVYLFIKLKNAHGENKRKKIIYQIINSFSVKVICAIRGYPKKIGTTCYSTIVEIAKGVNLCKPSDEPVKVIKKYKSPSSYRIIYSFGPIERAKQRLVSDLIAVMHGFSKYDFAIRGKGVNKAISEVLNQLKKGGYQAIGTIDVTNCFPSINMDAIQSVINLPKSIIINTILEKSDVKVFANANALHTDSGHQDHLTPAANSSNCGVLGLPQGSICSSIVAGKVLERILDKVSAKFKIAFVDDFLVTGKTPEDVLLAYETIKEAAKVTYPNTPLVLKFSPPVKLGGRMNFLGAWFRLKEFYGNKGTHVSPSEKALRKFYINLAKRLVNDTPVEEWNDASEQYVLHWSNSKKWWATKKSGRERILDLFYQEEVYERLEELLKQKNILSVQSKNKQAIIDFVNAEIEEIIPKTVLMTTSGIGLSGDLVTEFKSFDAYFKAVMVAKLSKFPLYKWPLYSSMN